METKNYDITRNFDFFTRMEQSREQRQWLRAASSESSIEEEIMAAATSAPDHSHLKTKGDKTFLFTSESVNEGHPGKFIERSQCAARSTRVCPTPGYLRRRRPTLA